MLARVRKQIGVPVLTDVHEDTPLAEVAEVVDVLQTPAFLCRQTNFIVAACSQGKPVNIKKGQFLSPWEMQNVVDKARSTGNAQIMVCERGFSFGYNNLVSDMRALAVMRATGCPVVFDATHSVQLPGGKGEASGGQREFVPVLARAAVAAGIAGLFMETHPDPAKALSDGPNAWPLGPHGVVAHDPRGAGSGRQEEALRGVIAMSRIAEIRGREIIDSRGNPTVEADVVLDSGAHGRAAVPSGASTGSREAVELRDGDPKRFLGKGVLKAVEHVNGALRRVAVGLDAQDQRGLDEKLIAADGTENKSKLGANAHPRRIAGRRTCRRTRPQDAAVSSSCRRRKPHHAGADDEHHQRRCTRGQQRRHPGVHDPAARRPVDVRGDSLWRGGFSRAQEGSACARAQHLRRRRGRLRARSAVERSGARRDPRGDRQGGLSGGQGHLSRVSTSRAREFYKNGVYELESEGRKFNSSEFADYLAALASKYPIVTIEDGMSEADWDGWALLTRKLGDKVQLVGDDVFVTNTKIFAEGIAKKIANAILIKPNQIGTLTETLAAIDMAAKANYAAIISHRSGETEDATIADIAVATAATQIKTGSMSRSDRIAKYNQLLRIEGELGAQARLRRKERVIGSSSLRVHAKLLTS